MTPQDVWAGVCSLGLILSLGLDYVEVGMDPDGVLWTAARVLALVLFVGGGVLWFLLWRRARSGGRG